MVQNREVGMFSSFQAERYVFETASSQFYGFDFRVRRHLDWLVFTVEESKRAENTAEQLQSTHSRKQNAVITNDRVLGATFADRNYISGHPSQWLQSEHGIAELNPVVERNNGNINNTQGNPSNVGHVKREPMEQALLLNKENNNETSTIKANNNSVTYVDKQGQEAARKMVPETKKTRNSLQNSRSRESEKIELDSSATENGSEGVQADMVAASESNRHVFNVDDKLNSRQSLV